MDPVAHTLVGAALAETGLKRASPLATAALVLGANAPDIDVVAGFAGSDAALYWRRGVTHGVVALIVLPIVQTGLLLAWDRYVRRWREPAALPARPAPLFWLGFIAVLTHPLLDWLNTYGVRMLMPFDASWFYGDTLFIIDPWIWLLLAAAVVLSWSRGKLSAAAFIVLGCAATALVMLTDYAPFVAKLLWAAGVCTIVALRLSTWARAHAARVASVSALAVALYIGAMAMAAHRTREQAGAWLRAQGIEALELAADPAPADPFSREVIARGREHYYVVLHSPFGDPPLRFAHAPIAIGPRNAITRAALAVPELRGLRVWLRFPSLEVVPIAGGHRVEIRDVRYSRRQSRGLGSATVELDARLQPLRVGKTWSPRSATAPGPS